MARVLSVLFVALVALGASTAAHAQQRSRRIDLAVQGADVRDVLRLIADVAQVNLVCDDSVAGTVTVQLRHVRWQDALDAVMQSKGLGAERIGGNILRVAPAETLRRERQARLDAQRGCEETAPLRTRYVQPSYADAESLAALIRAQLTARGSVAVDERTNTIIVRDVDCP